MEHLLAPQRLARLQTVKKEQDLIKPAIIALLALGYATWICNLISEKPVSSARTESGTGTQKYVLDGR